MSVSFSSCQTSIIEEHLFFFFFPTYMSSFLVSNSIWHTIGRWLNTAQTMGLCKWKAKHSRRESPALWKSQLCLFKPRQGFGLVCTFTFWVKAQLALYFCFHSSLIINAINTMHMIIELTGTQYENIHSNIGSERDLNSAGPITWAKHRSSNGLNAKVWNHLSLCLSLAISFGLFSLEVSLLPL